MEREKMKTRVLGELAGIAFANPADHMELVGGELVIRDTGKLRRSQRAAVASMEKTSSGIRLKFYDKLKALELLGKYLGLFDGGNAPTGGDNGLLEAIRQATEKEICTHEISELQ